MKPPGCSALRQLLSGRSLPEAASRPRRRLPSRLQLLLGLLLLSGPAWPQPWGAAAATALYWNETAGGIAGALTDEENIILQNNRSSSKNNNPSNEIQKEITLPSRLVYYINRDFESPYHILDTRARHQQKHNKLDFLQCNHILSVMRGSELDTVLQKWPHQCGTKGNNHFPRSAGSAPTNAPQYYVP